MKTQQVKKEYLYPFPESTSAVEQNKPWEMRHKVERLSPSISPSVRLTGTSCRLKVYEGKDEKDIDVRANHINPLGRSRSLPLIADQVEEFPAQYDFTPTPGLISDVFCIRSWIQDNFDMHSYKCTLYDDVLSLLWESPTARHLISFAASKNWNIIAEPLDEAAYDLDDGNKVLSVNNYNLKLPAFEKPGYFRHALILALVKGLRDIWHIEYHQPYEHGLSVESLLLLERVRAADCDVMSLLVAWELRGDGTPEIWRHLIGAPEGDMALHFTNALERQPGKLFDGSALLEAFRGWFENEARVAACDHQTLDMIDYYLEVARETGLYGDKRPAADCVESLSRLPHKSFYLKGYGGAILKDPHYSGLSDEVNQAYYLQLKKDLKTTTIGAVAFRDGDLAKKIFPVE